LVYYSKVGRDYSTVDGRSKRNCVMRLRKVTDWWC